MGNDCITSPLFFSIILGAVFVLVWVAIILYLGHKRKQNDLVWHIQAEELHFSDPPDIIGQGKEYTIREARNTPITLHLTAL